MGHLPYRKRMCLLLDSFPLLFALPFLVQQGSLIYVIHSGYWLIVLNFNRLHNDKF